MATPPAVSRDATPAPAPEAGITAAASFSSRRESLVSRTSSGLISVAKSRGPISPPPLKRLTFAVPTSRAGSSPAPSERVSLTNASPEHTREMPRKSSSLSSGLSSGLSIASPSQHVATPPSLSLSRARERWLGMAATPRAQTTASSHWTVGDIADRLKTFSGEIREGHAQLVAHAIESTLPTERRVFTGRDLFAGVSMAPVAERKGQTVRLKFKQHLKIRKDHKVEHYDAVCIKTNKDAVPSYRFHHVEIKKNVLTPNTMLTFVPHLRDLESSEEAKYNIWLKELEDIDLKSGFKPMNREEKHTLVVQSERAATISLYLDSWLDRLAIPHCTRSTLIRYMASQQPDDAMTPRQKTDIIRSHSDGNSDSMTTEATRAAVMFTSAFELAFQRGRSPPTAIDLRKVLLLDESVDNIMDNKSASKDTACPQHDSVDEVVESSLATYCILGCLVCFSHSCDHGEYDIRNLKRTFSLSSCSPLPDVLKRKRLSKATVAGVREMPCRRCREGREPFGPDARRKEWSEEERIVLRSLYITSDHSRLTLEPKCLAAKFLNRDCGDVYAEIQSMNLVRPVPETVDPVKPRNISWYDRKKKMLLGDWQDHTVSHEHQRREILEPCNHEGPCAPKVCSCVDAGVLCEKFCGCTVESCCYKFTGCACHSQGKACYAKQKDRPCICVQLNRECDPQLCGSCGALERADPANADYMDFQSTGCQNCELQCGIHRNLLLGRSQLEGVGYGLFTAEDIAQDEYIIEYVGELITHDEGVRREARRGDVFDEESNTSYVFTLLENEGIWVDAAIYGNLSRYINHASEHDTRGCNITPRILYVNGEYRIKFTALRDIKAGEELFFNYGENFPNLTKKLLDHKAGEKPEGGKSKVSRPKRAETGDRVARKAPRTEQRRVKRARTSTRSEEYVEPPLSSEETAEEASTRKRKRRLEDDGKEDEYQPPAGEGGTTSGAVESGGDYQKTAASLVRRRREKARLRSAAGAADGKAASTVDGVKPKPRGKRGGARPGSGRPRKHPRPEPAPTPAPKLPSSEVTTPKGKVVTRETGPIDVFEFEDSEDQDVVVWNRGARARRMPAKFRDAEVELV